MPAGDYLSYKGDWATNTAYDVNNCVTWTDGHLYEVIKAHTSSSTIDPSNTEYYKAMTEDKLKTTNLGTVNKTKTAELTKIINTVYSNIAKGRAVSVSVSQLDGINMIMTAYCPTPSKHSCALVGARRNSSTKAFELCYLLISTLSEEPACKYAIFNAETMAFIKSGDYSGTIAIES